MALTPEDVVNKRFQPTKFREGYDQDEVDDFLDEIVVELRRLNQENEDLRQRLVSSENRVSELQRTGSQAPVEEAAAPAPAAAVPAAAVPAPAAAPTQAPGYIDETTQSTNNLLQLARRLHEEHVREGQEKRDSLIAEGHATAARIVAEAEAKQRNQINALEAQRGVLEGRIDELRVFEREYRVKLRGYIEGQLMDLDASAGTPIAPAAPAATPAPATAGSFQGVADA
jgi:DivIVA domain-containing protein